MKDTTNRMVMGQVERDLDKKIEQAEVKDSVRAQAMSQAMSRQMDIPPLNLDLEDFFFTGNIQYTFTLGNKFAFTLKLPASDEIANLHRSLYKEVKDESETMTDAEFEIRRINGIVALSLMKYGNMDLSNKTKEERLAFVNNLPAVVVQTISRCYVRLENSASDLLDKSADAIKN